MIIIIYMSVLWKKKDFQNKVNKKRQNVLTINQTVALSVLVPAEILAAEMIKSVIPQDKVLLFEMLRLIFINNLCYRFLGKVEKK